MEFWRRKKKKKKKKDKENEKEEATKWFLKNGSKFHQELIADCNGISNPIRMFSSDQISKATNHFDLKSTLILISSHFSWYKGVIEGRSFGIKRYTKAVGGEKELAYNDIVISARVSNHNGFLKLIGCSLEFRYPVLVFEDTDFIVLNPRGSVGFENGPLLPWNVRLKIAKDVAIAVTYLHTAFPRIIIHRDITPFNVFLDKNWTAKLTDFSLSVTLPEGKSWIEDKVSGTAGYIDPNYHKTCIVTEYADVFSFGIFMLVLLIGRPAWLDDVQERGKPAEVTQDVFCDSKFLDYVKDLRERGEPVEFGGDSNDMRPDQMKMFLELALRCCEERNEDRPKMIMVAKEIKLLEKEF